MINGLKNMIAQVMYAPTTGVTQKQQFNNPFATNSSVTYKPQTFAVNKPVKGGYFAGYYNGKPNIVGQRLYIDA